MPSRRYLALACLIFFDIGWVAAVLGPALPDLAHLTDASLAAVGGVISALFVGALLAQAVSGALHDRFGVRPLLGAGLACLVVGMGGIALSHAIALTLLCGVIMGLGHGTVDIGISLFVALTFEGKGVAALNFTNIFFGVGAIAGPATASIALRQGGSALPALWGAVGIAVVALLLVQVVPLPPAAPAAPQLPQAAAVSASWWRSAALWLLGGLFLLYVGLENGLGSWTTELVHRAAGQSLATGALVAAGFWLALTGGRIVGTILGARMTAARLLAVCAGGAVGGAVLLLVSPLHPLLLFTGIAVLGLSFGPIYPTAVVLTTARFPQVPGKATSLVTSLGSLGGIVVPWALGWFLIAVSPLASLVLSAFLIVLLVGTIARVITRAAPPAMNPPWRSVKSSRCPLSLDGRASGNG